MNTEPGLRDRKKVRVHQSLAESAMRLFEERGFEKVTVDEIAARADVSRRTFFRYFPTKEAVVFARRDEQLAMFREALSGQTEGFEAIREALLQLGNDYTERRERILAEQRLIRSVPSLAMHDLEMDRAFEAVMVEHLLARTKRAMGDQRRARILAAAIIGATRVCIEEWAERNGEPDLRKLGAEALDLLSPLAPRPR
jgi:AcrR family transcriptional regulator